MGKIHYLGAVRSKPSAVVGEPSPTARAPQGAADMERVPVGSRRAPLPLFSVLVWCGVTVFMLGAMATVLATLGEITRQLKALGGRDASSVRAE